jgi:hypothetical protein
MEWDGLVLAILKLLSALFRGGSPMGYILIALALALVLRAWIKGNPSQSN